MDESAHTRNRTYRYGMSVGNVQEGSSIDQRLVDALAHPLRVQILERLQGRIASPKVLSKELDVRLNNLAFHVKTLEKVGAVEFLYSEPRGGSEEHFYTAVPRSFIGHQDWRRVPLSIRGGVTSEAIRTFVDKVGEALDADTIDRREDTTLNWMPVVVDEQGWRETAETLDRALKELMAVAAASRERLGDEDGIPVVTAMAAFEAPPKGDAYGPRGV
jgi:DNA-binding transcriptional ArsR family regulator